MLQIVIIEDEPLAAENLANMLYKIEPSLKIQAQIDSVEDAVQWFQNYQTDLIFLDIHLADDISFKIFEQVEPTAPIIFTTAYNQYALRAFKLNSLDYLLKPIDEAELKKALAKFNKNKSIQPTPLDYKSLLSVLQNTQQKSLQAYQKRFMVTAGDKVKSVGIEDIAYFFAESRYVFLVCKDNRKYILDYTLDKLAECLNPDDFCRINRHVIVGFAAITEMYSYPKGRVKIVLTPHFSEEVIVSLSRAAEFKEWLNR